MTNRSLPTIGNAYSQAKRDEHVWPFNSTLRELALDAACIILLFTATTAVHKFESIDRLVWLLADLTVVVMLVPWQREFLYTARRNFILLTWPMLATMSFLWSLVPDLSLYHGLQLFTTVLVGFMLTIFARIERLVPLVFTALAAAGVLSAAYIVVNPADGIAAAGEWQGLFVHKNTMGSMMSLLFVTAGCLFLQGWRRAVTAGAMVFAAALLLLSRSGTAVIALAVTLSVAPVVLVIRKGLISSSLGVGLALVVVAGGLMAFELAQVELVPTILDAVGKDETLTGRTVLWDIAMASYESRPWLGSGFKAWWNSYETDAAIVINLVGNDAKSFHNSLVEVTVAFGTMGPILLIVGLVYCLIITVRAYAADGRFLMLWPLLATVYTVCSCFAESMLFMNHGFYQLLLVVAAACASRQFSQLRSEQR